MPRPASRLFHTIVVVGASLGCSGSSKTGLPEPDAGKLSTGASDAAVDAGFPAGICDCTRPGEFRCQACASGDTPVQGRCPQGDGTRCVCDTSVPIATPTDCEHPEQFVCAGAPEVAATTPGFASVDWFAFADCSCDTSRPFMASQCTCEQCSLRCDGFTGCPSLVSATDASVLRWSCVCESLPTPVVIAPAP
jgi:hypothetical protein